MPSLERWRSRFEPKPEALELLDKATSLDFRGFHAGTTSGYLWDQVRQLFDLASFRTVYLASTGAGAGAAASLRSEIGLIAGRPSPLPLEWLTDYWKAESLTRLQWILNASPLTDADLVAVDAALARLDRDDVLEWYITTRRARNIDASFSVLGMYYGGTNVFGSYNRVSMLGRLTRPYAAHLLLRELAASAKRLDASHEPWPQRIDGILAVQGANAVNVRLLRRDVQVIAADLAVIRAGRLTVAVERYRQHAGTLPTTLNDLLPAYLSSAPIDPFSGRALVYRPTNPGFVVYSVGPNRHDDGGTVTGFEPLASTDHFWPPTTGDIGLRIAR